MTDLRRSLLRGMSDIVTDLYGEPAKAASNPPKPDKKEAVLPFDALWKTADESIDWTDILVSPVPTDGLTAPDRWASLHALAPKVLRGDAAAYLDALTCLNPVGDLTPYVTALDVSTVDADALSAEFAVRDDLLMADGRAYLAGLALRIARDLFAAVPVLRVSVTAKQGAETLLTAAFTRQQMNRVRFNFVEPMAFVAGCGGEFSL